MIEAADAATAAGAHEDAAAMLGALVRELPERENLVGKFALSLLALGDVATATEVLATAPADSKDGDVVKARAAVALAADAVPVDDLAGLKAEVAANPDNHQLRFDLAGALLAGGDRDGAADALLTIIAADRQWNEAAARTTLLKMFEATGLDDPWSIKTRARLRSVLFS
jgi:putative thioredoxin